MKKIIRQTLSILIAAAVAMPMVLTAAAEDSTNGIEKYDIGDNYETEVKKGDVNSDGVIDARDASIILTAYVKRSDDVDMALGDYDENGVIDARDASAVMTLYVTRES